MENCEIVIWIQYWPWRPRNYKWIQLAFIVILDRSHFKKFPNYWFWGIRKIYSKQLTKSWWVNNAFFVSLLKKLNNTIKEISKVQRWRSIRPSHKKIRSANIENMHDRRNAGNQKRKFGNCRVFSIIKRGCFLDLSRYWDCWNMQIICGVLSWWAHWLRSLLTFTRCTSQYHSLVALNLK